LAAGENMSWSEKAGSSCDWHAADHT